MGYETNGAINGRVFRAVSQTPGRAGLHGLYQDVPGTVIACTDPVRNNWEGIQGMDSFYPFRAGNKWLAFHGSSDTKTYWDVGLAEARSLEGPWRRIISPPVFRKAENPIVTKLNNGMLLAV